MNTRGTFGGTFGAANYHWMPFVPFLSDEGLPLKGLNPIARKVRSVAQPGSASGLGKVALDAFSRVVPTSSQPSILRPWEFPWDFLRESLHSPSPDSFIGRKTDERDDND